MFGHWTEFNSGSLLSGFVHGSEKFDLLFRWTKVWPGGLRKVHSQEQIDINYLFLTNRMNSLILNQLT